MSKRINYISWEDYFLSVSFLSGMRSKDPCSQVGACIVNKDKIIVSIGYNGMPRGCSDDDFPWAKQTDNILDTKYMYVCHAEMNAVLNKNSANVSGCTIYVALFPCNECAKILIQSRIVEVVYYSDKHKDKVETIASKRMLSMAGVKYRQYCPVKLSFDIVFKSPYATLTNGHSEPFSQADLDRLASVSLDRNINMKRSDYITWEEYFMALVFLAAQRSKDPDVQLGACIVNEENKIVGIGYNGMPRGCDDSDFPWQTSGEDPLNSKHIYICHAEMNAILNKNNSKISNCRMYVASFPCNECAKFIIQEDIKEIIYFSDQHSSTPQIQASKKMLDAVGVKYRSYEGMLISVTIDFREIDWNVNPDPVQ